MYLRCLCMLTHTNKLLYFLLNPSGRVHHSLPLLSSLSLPFRPNHSLTPSSEGPIFHVSALIKQPNWEQNNHLKSLVSHMTPHVAFAIISLHSHNTKLAVQFFNWVCKQSTFCYGLDSRIQLLNLMVSNNFFVITQKAIILLINQCCNGENEILKLMGAFESMREIGFRLNYPCYSSLLMCLAKLDMGLSAFLVYRRMVADGFVLDSIGYKTMINALCKNAFVQAAEMFLSSFLRLGFCLDAHICTSLVLGYCRLGDLREAFQVFDRMSKEDSCSPNSVTYSILIHGLCEEGRVEEAFQLKKEMSEKGCQPTTRTYTILIKAICDVGLTDKALGLLDEMVTKGCKPNLHTYTVFIDRLCREGKIEEANGMFRKMLYDGFFPGTVTYNALINGYCKEGMVISAFELLSLMERRNCKPNIRTYNELMEGLCRVNKAYKAMLLLRKVVENGLRPDRVSYNILVDGFCKEGQLNMAFNILNLMFSVGLEPDHFTYTELVDGLCKERRPEEANGLLGLMLKKGISPDEVTFTAIIDGYCKAGKIGNAFRIFEKMVENRCLKTPHMFNLLLDVLNKEFTVNEGIAVFAKMVKYGLNPSVVTFTTLIDGFFRAGETNHYLKILELMKQASCPPNVCTYTVVINGLCQNGREEEAEALLFNMSSLGVSPNHITYTVMVKAHVKDGRLDRAFEIVGIMVKNGLRPNSRIYCALLAGFLAPMNGTDVKPLLMGETGDGCSSNNVFREMDVTQAFKLRDKIEECGGPTIDFYNLLITGLCRVGRVSEADYVIQEMVRRGLFLERAVCSCIIECFSKEGKYDYCLEILKLVSKNGLIPSFASYCTVILGLRNQGKVQEAEKLVSDLLRFSGVEDKAAVTPYIEFLVKEDQPHEWLELLKLKDIVHHNERPII